MRSFLTLIAFGLLLSAPLAAHAQPETDQQLWATMTPAAQGVATEAMLHGPASYVFPDGLVLNANSAMMHPFAPTVDFCRNDMLFGIRNGARVNHLYTVQSARNRWSRCIEGLLDSQLGTILASGAFKYPELAGHMHRGSIYASIEVQMAN